MRDFVIYVLIFYAGAMIGFLIRNWIASKTHYDGMILVTKTEGKTMYTLVLDDYPDKLEFKKKVILSVNSADESPTRD